VAFNVYSPSAVVVTTMDILLFEVMDGNAVHVKRIVEREYLGTCQRPIPAA
jgi:hypothetical protein